MFARAAFLPDSSGLIVAADGMIFTMGLDGNFLDLVTTKSKKAFSIGRPDYRFVP
jgi:hypothetical protein